MRSNKFIDSIYTLINAHQTLASIPTQEKQEDEIHLQKNLEELISKYDDHFREIMYQAKELANDVAGKLCADLRTEEIHQVLVNSLQKANTNTRSLLDELTDSIIPTTSTISGEEYRKQLDNEKVWKRVNRTDFDHISKVLRNIDESYTYDNEGFIGGHTVKVQLTNEQWSRFPYVRIIE